MMSDDFMSLTTNYLIEGGKLINGRWDITIINPSIKPDFIILDMNFVRHSEQIQSLGDGSYYWNDYKLTLVFPQPSGLKEGQMIFKLDMRTAEDV